MALIHEKKVFKHNSTFKQLVNVMKMPKGGIAEINKNLLLQELDCPPYEFSSCFKSYVTNEYSRGSAERTALLYTCIVIQANMSNDTVRIVFKTNDQQQVSNLPVIKIYSKLRFNMGTKRGWYNNGR